MRWFGVSMKPPSPGVDASTKVSGETHSAFADVRRTWSSETPFFSELGWVDLDLQLPVAESPDGHVGHAGDTQQAGTTVQRESSDMSIRELSLEESPIIMSRPVDDSGCTTNGGFDDAAGRAGAMVRRS